MWRLNFARCEKRSEFEQSMSRAEETYDNPRAESLFPRYKAELLEGAAFANRLFFVQLQSHRFTSFPCVNGL